MLLLFNSIMSLCYTIKEIIPDNNHDLDMIQQDVIKRFNTAQENSAQENTAQENSAQENSAQENSAQENESRIFAQKLEYSFNYKVKELCAIMGYYSLSRRKMTKDDMINIIINYENQEENLEITNKRKRLWKYAKELKEDNYFSKIILFDF